MVISLSKGRKKSFKEEENCVTFSSSKTPYNQSFDYLKRYIFRFRYVI